MVGGESMEKVPTTWLIADDLVAIDDDLLVYKYRLQSARVYDYKPPYHFSRWRYQIKRDIDDAVNDHIDEVDAIQQIIEEVFKND